ncbi:MAG: hypothetical protein HXX10_28570 [Rhodoplanes sp.]|uniref:HdeA/HdeB family chaperone n=1 Tax=Rhodoplanes sp. TaxID=1968906 RepID=UPI0018222807|nr:HdeA/HdeB family chaperone [Rhodoplanes sp.]NVO17993.1 hypothetical protein [Rhodoplanes sp.]
MPFGSAQIRVAVIAAAVLAAVLPVRAQDQVERTIEQFACKDVMRDSGPDRDVAIAFLHGYLLGKSGGSKFNTERLRAETNAFIDRCLDNPNEKAEQAMIGVKK